MREKRGMTQDISTHTLTWSVTLLTSMVMKSIADFNSHAHVERDEQKTATIILQ